jgi:hypothetical protein
MLTIITMLMISRQLLLKKIHKHKGIEEGKK